MKDEEMAEEYVKKEGFKFGMFGELDNITSSEANKEIKQAFLAGLKAGRPQWHDLRKDPTDLPKEEREYIVMNANEGGDTSYWICYYWKEEKKFTGYGLGEANVIKWKEIE